MTRSRRSRAAAFIAIGGIATLVSALLDRPVAAFATNHDIPQWLRNTGVAEVFKSPGEFWFTAVLAIVATICYAKKPQWHAGFFVLLCGCLSGVNGLIKWFVGRARPYHVLDSKQEIDLVPFHFEPFFNGFRGLFGTTNFCFPSGHGALAFANAAAIAILFPRWRWVGYVIATLTLVERSLETAHYVSDCVGSAVLGIGGAHLLGWLLPRQPQELETPIPSSAGPSRV